MKKIASLVFCGILLICGSACSKKNTAAVKNTDDRLNVTATIFAPYDFARQIGGDKINLLMLLPPGAESHSYEPTPQDIIAIQKSRVFIYGGGESDAWVDRILSSIDTSKMQIVKMMDAVSVVEEETVEGMQAEEEGEGEEPEYDEHVWTSPKNAILIVGAITNALCQADSGSADFYRANEKSYDAKLAELDKQFQALVDHAKRKTIVFGDRFPFRYFADSYGLKYFAAFPGCSTETEPSAATVAFLINKIKAEKIPVIFHIELSNEKMADTIAAETAAQGAGAKKLLFNACHNISKKDFESGVTYLDCMTKNVAALKEALN